jgi:hypothetical protein
MFKAGTEMKDGAASGDGNNRKKGDWKGQLSREALKGQ